MAVASIPLDSSDAEVLANVVVAGSFLVPPNVPSFLTCQYRDKSVSASIKFHSQTPVVPAAH